MALSSPLEMRTLHLLKTPDILLANDNRLFVSYLPVNTRDTPHGQTDGDEPEIDGQLLKTVRREKAPVHSGRQTRPGTGSLHPVAIEAAAEVTKPLEPSV
jgi:hypothetical protein